MHELGLCDAMLRKIREIAKENDVEIINSVTVEVGSLSGVVPRFLTDCWTAVTDGTELADTKMIVETVDGEAKCLDCEEVFVADLNNLKCPKCGSDLLAPVSGVTLTIKEIEAC